MTKEQIMARLLITENQILKEPQTIVEKIFCAAILRQGTDISLKILKDYNEMMDILHKP